MKGQILTELIIAITITAILAAIGAQLIGVSFYSAGTSEDRQAASRLGEEVFEALRAITQGNTTSTQGWNRLYLPPDGTGNASSSKGAANFYKVFLGIGRSKAVIPGDGGRDSGAVLSVVDEAGAADNSHELASELLGDAEAVGFAADFRTA